MNETRYPLCWPPSWRRAKSRVRAQFKRTEKAEGSYPRHFQLTVPQGFERIQAELDRMGVNAEDVIVSTNVVLNLSGAPHGGRAEPSDPGVAVYWTLKGKKQCMAIDRYDRVADNLAAVAATLEALRAIERHGGGAILERAFMGFAQLPAAIITQRPWRDVFGFGPNDQANARDVETRFRVLAHKLHPDKNGGSHDSMTELNAARAAALAEVSQ